MFYSQFILAKKGPLGTIWIAAHLERKLRKNQVADTDIGVSVDSILSPDVPIALRLSSHLLLGVVRIYSRKVNYLFNDCSEALLKIKQAFRSTVVDLPPEESTAPYHSITLPETFDLDDFELPDSDFQGNYTDHHISTREQITLQDSVEGPSYTTLQFGLDERFGDGDSSQMRLVLDEDLFMGNVPSPQVGYVQLGTEDGTGHEGQSSTAHTNMDVDKGSNGMNSHIPNLSEVLSNDSDKNVLSSVEKLRMGGDSSQLHGYNIPMPDVNQLVSPDYHAFTTENVPSSSLFDHAQAPATPGLLEETIRADVQEIPGLSPQEKTVSSSAMEVINTDNSVLQSELEVSPVVNTIDRVNDMTMVQVPEHNSHSFSPLNSLLSEAKPVSLAPECLGGFSSYEALLQCGGNTDDHLHGEFVHKTKPVGPSSKGLDGLLAAPNVTHLECEQKSIDQMPSGFIFNGSSNLPLMHDGVEAVRSEVTHQDCHVTSSHSFQAAKLDTSNKLTADEVVVVSSHDNVWVPGLTPETNSASLQNKADPSVPSNEQMGDMNSCVTRKTPVLSSDLYLRPCNSQMNLGNIVPSEAVNINKVDASILGNQSHVNNGDSHFVANAPAFGSGLHLQPCSLPLSQGNILSAEAGSLVENTPAYLQQSVPTYVSDTPLVKQPPHVNASLVQNAPAYSQSVPTYISDMPLVKQPLHVNASLVQNAPAYPQSLPTYISDTPSVQTLPVDVSPASSPNVATYISDTPLVKQPPRDASLVENIPAASQNVPTYISGTPMVKQPQHVNASLVENTPAASHNVPTYISDTPVVKQPPHVNASLVENTPALLHNVPTYISEIPMVKQPPHVNASFYTLPGEGNLAVNTTNSFQETHQRSDSLLSNILSDGSRQANQLISVFPEKTQRVDPTSLSSMGYPEPEKMILASSLDFNLPNGSGRLIADKGVSQSAKNIGPISNLSSNKDYSMDSSTILNNSKTHDQMTSLFSKESQLGRVIASKGVSQPAKNISPFSNLSGSKDYSINSSTILNNSKIHDQMPSLFSKEGQLGNSNGFSSSRCPEPEKMLFASSSDVNQPNYQGQITAVKGVSESAESFNQISSLSGKKRPLTENSTFLQNSNSLRRSSLPRVKKSSTYMPDDDDLLGSILGGRAPTLRMGPTPSLSKAASRKRPRLTPRVGVPKRKVLMDDTMVLHADAIRKQLVNIEDIRRLRKKAPCTRPEIWMIQKNLMEEELFSESLFTGISTELTDLYTRTYDMNDTRTSPIVDREFDLYVESSKDERPRMEPGSRSSERETGDRNTAVPDRPGYGVLGSSGTPVSIPTDSGKEAAEPHVQDKLEHVSQLGPSSNNQTITMPTGIVHARAGVELHVIRAPHPGNEREASTVSRIEKEFVPKTIEVTAIVQEQELVRDSFQHFDRPTKMADRAVNLVGAAVNDVTSADDEARCRIIDAKMQEPTGTFVSVEVPKFTEAARFNVASAENEARCRIIDTEMQEPSGTSVSVEVPKRTETPGLEVHEKLEHHISQLGPSSNIQTIAVSTGNVRETMVVQPLISSSRSGPELAISTVSSTCEETKNTLHEQSSNNQTIAGNVREAEIVQPLISSRHSGPELAISTVARNEEEAKNTLREPPSNNQTIAVSIGNVHETVVVQPLISSPLSGPEIAISTVPARQQEAKNTPYELSSNNQTIAVSTGNVRETVVAQPLISSPLSGPEIAISTIPAREQEAKNTPYELSGNNQITAVSTGNIRETVVVQPLISSPFSGPEIAISTVSIHEEEEAKNTLHGPISNNQTIAVSTENIRETVADLPLMSGHELATPTISTQEEAKNTPHEPELIPSEKPIEMFDRPSKPDTVAVDDIPTTEYLDTGNFVRTAEAIITEDPSFSQKDGRTDAVDLSGLQYDHINGESLVSMLEQCLSEDGAGLPANDPIPETARKTDEPTEVAMISNFHAMEEIENELAVAVRGEHVAVVETDEPTSEGFRSENPPAVAPFLHQHNTETENVLSAAGDNSGLLECIVEGSLDGESAPMDTGAARESGVMQPLNNGVEVNLEVNDTEFLNAEYEADAAGNDLPDSEASLENSGWSTRTRGVARYLKTLFDAEHGRGKKIVPVDHLLVGKTRKEASRMFFETLVLKTRDYIHVEQEVPFESIKIKPRPKLLKSEF